VQGMGGRLAAVRHIKPNSPSCLGWTPTRFALRLLWPYPKQRLGRCADTPLRTVTLNSES
jgi:hypothetical protein